jgi:acyl carrier protein
MTVAERVRSFVKQNFHVEDPADLADDASLIARGIVDSTGMLEIITFLETEYGIRISDQETVPENLETLGRIGAFVEKKKLAATGS